MKKEEKRMRAFIENKMCKPCKNKIGEIDGFIEMCDECFKKNAEDFLANKKW